MKNITVTVDDETYRRITEVTYYGQVNGVTVALAHMRPRDRGVVINVGSHGEIAGLMAPMTMGFRTASPKIHEGLSIGDEVRFTLRGVPPNVAVTAIEKTK